MRCRILSLAVLVGTLTAIVPTAREASALPPPAPAEFAQPQSPTKPPPFPINMVDQGTFDPKLKGFGSDARLFGRGDAGFHH